MATTIANGGPTVDGSSTVGVPGNGKQQQSKSVAAADKSVDSGRKQAGTPGDGSARRNPPPKAWTGVNPITQRSTNTGQPNGASPQPKSHHQKGASNTVVNEKLERDRLLHLLGNFMGHTATVTLKDGKAFSGVFFGASTENCDLAYLLKMVQLAKAAGKGEANGVQNNIEPFMGVGEDHAMSFDHKDVSGISVDGVELTTSRNLQNGSVTGFRTDADISGNYGTRERQLQRWTPSSDSNVDLSLEGAASGGEWDQFKANEHLFGLKSDYDENIYTTTIDRTNPSYREREARAQRLANEIEGSSTNNPHIREERGLVDEHDEIDEEDKYSGVRRHGADYPPLQSSQANRYMPPARRPPSGKPTVPGAPVDPAIISSQIARSNANSQEPTRAPVDPAENPAAVIKPGEATSSQIARDSLNDGPSTIATDASGTRPADARKAPTPTTTTNLDTDVRDAFQKFANSQKSRVAEDRRKRVNQDKAIKLNDLKKFSTNFKLNTPVPKDLVPILAKDTAKQHEIVEKAQREWEKKENPPTKSVNTSGDQKLPPKSEGIRAPPNTAIAERQDHTLPRQGLPPRGPQAGLSSRDKHQQFANMFPPAPLNGQGMLSHRLAENHSRHKTGMPATVPPPLPIQTAQKPPSRPSANVGTVPGSQASSTARTPTSAVSTRFNVNARDFKPNPAANSFKPTGEPSTSPSPKSVMNPHSSAEPLSPSHFFGSKKPLPPGEKPSILAHFNPLKRLKEKAEKENKVKDYALNGGIVYAHATPVTWTQVDNDKDFKSYKDMFEGPPPSSGTTSPQHAHVSPIGNQALLHQLPPHLQNGAQGIPQIQAPHQPPYQGPPQPHHYSGMPHHYEEQRMHPSSSTTYTTPRMQHAYVAYPQALGQPMPFPGTQPLPPYAMAPSGPQTQNFRQYHGGPPFPHSPGQHFAAPMMVHNSSQGGYMSPHPMPAPQMHVYPAGQVQYNGQPQPQPPNGYPSPGRGTAMAHQTSYQGQNGQMVMNGGQFGPPIYAPQQPPAHSTPMRSFASPQPHYNQSPQQQAHFPPQMGRVPSNSYNHHPQGQYQHLPNQHPHPPGVPVEGAEGMK